MTYEQWEAGVPEQIRADLLWKQEIYRLALFVSDLAWEDSGKLLRERRTTSIADQLYRATGNISSNIAEDYSRGTGKDRARFYEYALGSARESRDWYYKARRVLREKVTDHRIDLMTQVIRLTLTTIRNERRENRRFGSAQSAPT
jgi:four helix bundle protein